MTNQRTIKDIVNKNFDPISQKVDNLSDSLTENISTITSDMRIHMSKNPIYKLEQKDYNQSYGSKPNGLWYGFGKEWLDWIDSEMPEWKGEHIYKVNVNTSNILQIKDYLEIENFTKEYLRRVQTLPSTFFIDWNRISLKYDGIEINPYMWKYRHELLWYYGWDIASGCVWNLDKVTIEKL